jgi:NADH:ubiquinone oxidoreductase subunit C
MFHVISCRLFNIYLNIIEFCCRAVKKNIPNMLLFLKYDWYHQFQICIDLIGYDRPGKLYRFTIIYYLLSLVFNTRIHLLTQTDELTGLLSNYMLFKSLNWSERELWDMYGILIYFHPDLRRILTDYGFSNFPLRKDFPLSGFVELVYSDYIKNVEYREVELSQELRKTGYKKPWKSSVSKAV